MKKFLKIFQILFVNFLFLIAILFISDFIIFNKYIKQVQNPDIPVKFQYKLKHPFIHYTDLNDYFNGESNIWRGRAPDGTEYNGQPPIIVFGGSFAHGQYLNYDQTFSYKLAHILKRPVYNRAIPAGGFQHMYYQTLLDNFYKEVPPSDTVFFILIDDHYKRMLKNSINITDNYLYLRYSYKNGKLTQHKYNILTNFLKSSYTFRLFYYTYINFIINNQKNADKITDMALAYFIESRKELEKHRNCKIKKFVVIFYTSWSYNELLREKLEKNGFIVLETRKLTDKDLNSPAYFMPENGHPKEAAWDLLTPLITAKIF